MVLPALTCQERTAAGVTLVDGDGAPDIGQVVTPQRRVQAAGAPAEVSAGEVVVGVLAGPVDARL